MSVLADGRIDAFYQRFTSGRHCSLILGSSRAAQGIRPEVFNQSDLDFSGPILNYSFTLANSPYGEVYLNAIQEKTCSDTSDQGIFILEVNPWSLSTGRDELDIDSLREDDSFLDVLHIYNQEPNFEYLLTQYSEPYYTLLWKRITSGLTSYQTFLHEDGWLEITIPMDVQSQQSRLDTKIAQYQTNVDDGYEFSELRFEYLLETIEFLNSYGDIYLVRLPVSQEMLVLEDEYILDFSETIQQLSIETEVVYFDFTVNMIGYETTDGNHLWKESAEKLSLELLSQIEAIHDSKTYQDSKKP